jgi:hypothetical protein
MNTRSAREHTIFTPAQLLRNWLEQRPNNQGYIGSMLVLTQRFITVVTKSAIELFTGCSVYLNFHT